MPSIMPLAARFAFALALFGIGSGSSLRADIVPPTIVGAASPASGQIKVGWHFRNTDQTGPAYDVFRALGTCGAPGPFALVANNLTVISYLDTGLSDGQSYAYEIESTGAPGVRSACVEARPGDPCVAPPLFPGLGSINDAQIQCALTSAAPVGVPLCGNSVVYDAFRSTVSGFVPSKANQIVFHSTSINFIDTTVVGGVTYYYVERAVDATNGVADQNTIEKSGVAMHCGTPPPPTGRYFTVLPCRLVDTRRAAGPFGGPALSPSAARSFTVANNCGVAVTAKAVALRVSVTEPGAPGSLALYPSDLPAPLASTINFSAGQTRTNNAIVSLSPGGSIAVLDASAGAVHVIVDVEGYFD